MIESATHGTPIPGASKKVAYTGTAAATAALTNEATSLRMMSTTDCFVEIGLDPTAVVDTGMILAAFVAEYVHVKEGPMKVSAIQLAAGGTLYVTPFR
jgi:hypothetical protein